VPDLSALEKSSHDKALHKSTVILIAVEDYKETMLLSLHGWLAGSAEFTNDRTLFNTDVGPGPGP